jgi:hypothetical protein
MEKENDFTVLETKINHTKLRFGIRNSKFSHRFAPKWLRKYHIKKLNIDDSYVVAIHSKSDQTF